MKDIDISIYKRFVKDNPAVRRLFVEWIKTYNTESMAIKIEDVGLSVRALNSLRYSAIFTVFDLIELDPKSLLRERNIGPKTYQEIMDVRAQYMEVK